jgi:hypothetical protein
MLPGVSGRREEPVPDGWQPTEITRITIAVFETGNLTEIGC